MSTYRPTPMGHFRHRGRKRSREAKLVEALDKCWVDFCYARVLFRHRQITEAQLREKLDLVKHAQRRLHIRLVVDEEWLL